MAPLNYSYGPGSSYSDNSPLNRLERNNKLDVEGALSSHQTEVHSTHNVEEVNDALSSHQTEDHSPHNVEEVDDVLSSHQTEDHYTHNVQVHLHLSSSTVWNLPKIYHFTKCVSYSMSHIYHCSINGKPFIFPLCVSEDFFLSPKVTVCQMLFVSTYFQFLFNFHFLI